MPYKVEHDREAYIGAALCVVACTEYWEMREDGKSMLKDL